MNLVYISSYNLRFSINLRIPLYKGELFCNFFTMIRYREIKPDFPDIWRVFISGCSSAGKTFFAKQLLDSNLFEFSRIYYFHPDFHESKPVEWNYKNIIFIAGVPSLDEILNIPQKSCIILDDLFAECKKSKVIDYLFRVLSGKRKLHVFIMTQRYFSNGLYTLNIRNSCNIHILMRNADELTNMRVARSLNLKDEVKLATQLTENELYPYIFINKSNQARVNGLQVCVDLFSRYRKFIMKSGLYYLITERDFKNYFITIDGSTAIQNGGHSETEISGAKKANDCNSSNETNDKPEPWSKHNFERRVRKVIRRYRKRSIF